MSHPGEVSNVSHDEPSEAALAAFEHAPGLLAVAEGPDLVLTAMNADSRAVFGDLRGRPVAEAFPGPAGAPLVARAQEVATSGVPFVEEEWRVPARSATAADAYYRCVLTPWRDDDGEVRGVIAQASDSTAAAHRRAAAAAVARTREAQARADADTEVLVTLQDALLPDGLPIVPGLSLAARYLLAQDGTCAGGDWFDVLALADGRTVMVVGDVVGHGVRASVVMGELRSLFEERVREDGDVVAALEMLERRARRVPAARSTTVCVAVVSADRRTLHYCTAGHPPPLVASATGDTTYLPGSGAAPLGAGGTFALEQRALADGDLVLLYSDGLVERPGRSASQNTLDLAHLVGRVVDEAGPACGAASSKESLAEVVARRTVEDLTRAGGMEDDVTLVAAQVVAAPKPLELVLPAFPDTLRAVRHSLSEWLDTVHVGRLDELALQHAVGELVSNAVEHAYLPDVPRTEAVVVVHGALLPGGLIELSVSDRGQWRAPGADRGRGRGLAMARGFADELDVSHDEHGTTVRLRYWPTTEAGLLTSSAAPGRAGGHEPMVLEATEGGVTLRGAVDQRAADEFRRRLAHATRGGTREVWIDLSEVTLLASAGVQTLFEVIAPADDRDPSRVRLVAPMGSPAQHVLDLVRLPYVTSTPEEHPSS
ncbi:SpoIIE family protein phosphatase [Nocardioides sp. zg-DK7169]|uniref:SpoIIE family protein phosphatase n=1 Tax=Nocardioides sp. zg-DK7169 TaxID=2736600 RepID=UPI001552DAA2|nr:SpoIIE family protein phosphatase [Nocardioides sp. zg-DK7169]NPC98342.1 SpoIIE family protein phosphatase [Nocardioides sp. zg-DK7169]